MSLWQNTIAQENQSSSSNEVLASEIEGVKSYERKTNYVEPSLLSALLNTTVEGIFANQKFCFYLAENGLLYSTGYDFRFVKREDLYGIPR